MKIENFDTGLKGLKEIENIIITPEENFKNKQKVKKYLTDIVYSGKSKLDDNLNKYFIKDVKVNCFHPVNEFSGVEKFKEEYWLPLFNAFPDLERRNQLIIGGTFRDKIQVASISTLLGIFKKEWLGIKPNNKMVNLRCCEIHELKNDKIVECHILIDVIDLIFQTGVYPINKSRGSEGNWLSPINTDGVNFFEQNFDTSKFNLEQALTMQRSLNIKPELESDSDEDLKSKLIDHPQAKFWHNQMIWYGPSGIGTARSLEGFIDNHQLPFRKTFKERNYWKLGHYSELGDGKFSLTAGWHSIQATYGSNDWLGYTPNHKNVTMRVMDFYHHDEGKIRENWVPIDLAHILKQIDVDIFQLIKKQ